MTDARFEDAAERPLRLIVQDEDDLKVAAALLQDAVLPAGEIRWNRRRRELALLLNRFRWEDAAAAERRRRPYERVQCVMLVRDVVSVASMGVDRGDPDTVLSVLSLEFEPGADGTGALIVTLAGDGAIRAGVECLDATVTDVTRPYVAPSGKRPSHPD